MKANGEVDRLENSIRTRNTINIQNNEATSESSKSFFPSAFRNSEIRSSSFKSSKFCIKLTKLNNYEYENMTNTISIKEEKTPSCKISEENQEQKYSNDYLKRSSTLVNEQQTNMNTHLKEIKSSHPIKPAEDVVCKCRKKGRVFNCSKCTRNYPINVRRTVCGDIDTYGSSFSTINTSDNINKKTVVSSSISSSSLSSSSSSKFHNSGNDSSTITSTNDIRSSDQSSSITKHLIKPVTLLKLKPSPIPVSSTLISLLNMNNRSNNNFAPPPNINIALFQQNSKK